MNEIAPCGINCMACYRQETMPWLSSHQNKPEHCRNCNIKTCAAEHKA